tara:strand:+ start:34094 stop:35068 length:975 start_codon:yes stop_codon:yes gene_type:complete
MIPILEDGVSPPNAVTSLPHDRSSLLWKDGSATNLFTNSIDRWIDAMVADEHGGGSSSDEIIIGIVRAKKTGLLSGCCVVDRLATRHFDCCSINWNYKEGSSLEIGDTVLSITGPAHEILRIERILLNILGRLSGIATNTSHWVIGADSISVACTRKTEWGLLDKWAVHVGGGLTHRLDRSDAIMIKENDLPAMSPEIGDECDAIADVVRKIDLEVNANFCVVEVRNYQQAKTAVRIWSENQIERGGLEKIVLLLDNMGPKGCAEVNLKLEKEDLRSWCILEGSGNVIIEDLKKWAESGVDLVSTSALNRGVSPLDLSMSVRGE